MTPSAADFRPRRPAARPPAGARAALCLSAWVLAAACAGCRCNCPQQKVPHFGPTLAMDEVVRRVNANNEPIRSIWAYHNFDAVIVDEKGRSHAVSGEGPLLFLKPRDLLIRGKAVIGPIFEIGSTQDEYWMNLVPEESTQWWGRYRNVDKPCSKTIPIRPDLILEVLGVADFNTNFREPPVPVMRFNNEERAYMFLWTAPRPDRWVAQKEIWYDMATFLPTRVLLYDGNGRVVLRAALSDYKGINEGRGPMVATRYDLYFPDTRSRLKFALSDLQPTKNGLPRPGSTRRRPGDDLKVIQLDEDCGD